jgi:hypothetical protein
MNNLQKNAHTQILNIHALSGNRTQDSGFLASEDSACLRLLGYRDRLYATKPIGKIDFKLSLNKAVIIETQVNYYAADEYMST